MVDIYILYSLFFYYSVYHRDLPSFPTRRSFDLARRVAQRARGDALRIGSRRWVLRDRTSRDRKSTRLNSSHVKISYAVFCLKKKMYRLHVIRDHHGAPANLLTLSDQPRQSTFYR